MDRTRIGFIGCGGVAQQHFKGIATFEDVEIAAFCDLNTELAQETAGNYGGKPYTESAAMYAEEQLDAVYIILPPFAHGPAEFAAIERNLPFFVEKPVGCDLGVLKEIASAVSQSRLITAAGYMTRYRQSVAEAKKTLADDPAVMAIGGWIGGAPGMTAPIHNWWVVKERSGGQLVEQTTHTVDLTRYLLGEAVEVQAASARGFITHIPTYTNDDASLVTVRFRSGAIATFYSSCAADAGGDSKGVHLNIYARRHTLEFSGWDQSVVIHTAGESEPRTIKGEPDIFQVEDRAFIDAVRSGDSSGILCDYADGFRTTQLTLAATEAMRTHRAVALPY